MRQEYRYKKRISISRQATDTKIKKHTWKNKLLYLYMGVFSLQAEAITLNPGQSWSKPLNGTVNKTAYKSGTGSFNSGYGEAFVINKSNSDACLLSSALVTNSQGYVGLPIGNNDSDIVLQLQGTAQGKTPFNGSLRTANGTWSPTGEYSVSPVNSETARVWCGGAWSGNSTISNGTVKTASVNVTAYIRVGTLAKPGDYTVPPLYLTMATSDNFFSGNNLQLMDAATLTIPAPLECTISAPPTINFRQIDMSGAPSNGVLLNEQTGNLVVNCTGNAGTTSSATVTVRGPKEPTSNHLQLTLDSGQEAPGKIGGRIGPNITPIISNCTPSSSSGGIVWGANTPLSVGNLSVGSNNIPYRFGLCSKGMANPNLGHATAQATISLNWD